MVMSLTTPIGTSPQATKAFQSTRKRFQNPVLEKPKIVLDEEGTIQEVSPAARRLLGYTASAKISPCFFSCVHGKNLYQVMRDVADMVCYGKPSAAWLLRLRSGDGRWRWFKVHAQAQVSGDERTIHLTLNDVSEW
jgi:PAS domain S-box-containing protein